MLSYRRRAMHAPAPPAIVPRRYGLISMTFLTVPEARWCISVWQRSICRSRTDVASSSSPRVHSDDNASLETEGERGGSMRNLDSAGGIGVVVGVQPQESRWLDDSQMPRQVIRSKTCVWNIGNSERRNTLRDTSIARLGSPHCV